MGSKINIFSNNHNKTSRNYIERMNDDKIKCMIKSRKFANDYWDGDRRFGYGGYNYIEGRNTEIINKISKKYKISNKSKILDIGCGKGYLLYDFRLKFPKLQLKGIDISSYAIKNSPTLIKKDLLVLDARKKLPFKNKEFDLCISAGTLHNFELHELKNSLKEISRVSKNSIIMVESYRNEEELFNLQCWALTAKSFLSVKEWKWIFNEFNYNGDYDFIFFT